MTIQHPFGDFRCWGIRKMGSLQNSILFIRDNLSISVINLNKNKCFVIAKGQDIEISKNLWGHGSILEISKDQ